MLSDKSRKSPRNMTIAELNWQGKPFVFINTHLHTGKGREQQLQEALAELSVHPRAILVGDFNSRRDTPVLATALSEEAITDAIAQAQLDLNNEDRIDWILTKGFKVISGKMLEKGISDHPYYQVSLNWDN
jgi:endonuclease/exonuclease/phosphatase family metal-dependent hydrolase